VAPGGSAPDPEVVAQLLARSRHPLGESLRERGARADGRGPVHPPSPRPSRRRRRGKHINNILKLGLAPGDRDHRRVLAVLRYLGT
jgi:hypothetical protein